MLLGEHYQLCHYLHMIVSTAWSKWLLEQTKTRTILPSVQASFRNPSRQTQKQSDTQLPVGAVLVRYCMCAAVRRGTQGDTGWRLIQSQRGGNNLASF